MIKRGLLDANGNPNTNFRFKTIEQGASTSVWAAVAPELEGTGGLYLENCSISSLKPSREEIYKNFNGFLSYAIDEKSSDKLWELSEKMVKNN